MPPTGEPDAVRFYEGLLGIPQVSKPAHIATRGGCWFERGELEVHLGVDADFRPARKGHPAFVIEGLDDLLITLRAAGVRVVDDEPLEGYDRAYTDDPFGNRNELMEPRSEEQTSEIQSLIRIAYAVL